MTKYNVSVPSEDEACELIDSKEVDLGNESFATIFRAGCRYYADLITGYYLGGASAITLVDDVVHESLELGTGPSPTRVKYEEMASEVLRLKKILAHVPARIAIKAKEDAGYGDVIRLQNEILSRPECPFHYCDTKPPHEECKDRCHHAQ